MYGRLRPYLNKVFTPEIMRGICSTEFIVFRRREEVISRYLLYFLNSWDFVSFATLPEYRRSCSRVDLAQLA